MENAEKKRPRVRDADQPGRSIISGEGDSDLIAVRTHQMGDIGYLIYQHACFYSKEYGFDISFESYVAGTMIKFIDNYNEKKKGCGLLKKTAG